MTHDQYDDIDDDDEDEILQDGQSVRVPITFMDAERKEMLRQKYQGHRPGFRYADADDNDVEDARDEYIRYLQDAHRTNTTTDLSAATERPTSLADARAEADAAYEERSEWLREAYKGQQP